MALEEEKAWLDAKLVDGGNAKGEDTTMDDLTTMTTPMMEKMTALA